MDDLKLLHPAGLATTDPISKPTLTANDLAALLGCCRRTIYRRDDAGEIPSPGGHRPASAVAHG